MTVYQTDLHRKKWTGPLACVLALAVAASIARHTRALPKTDPASGERAALARSVFGAVDEKCVIVETPVLMDSLLAASARDATPPVWEARAKTVDYGYTLLVDARNQQVVYLIASQLSRDARRGETGLSCGRLPMLRGETAMWCGVQLLRSLGAAPAGCRVYQAQRPQLSNDALPIWALAFNVFAPSGTRTRYEMAFRKCDGSLAYFALAHRLSDI